MSPLNRLEKMAAVRKALAIYLKSLPKEMRKVAREEFNDPSVAKMFDEELEAMEQPKDVQPNPL